MVHELSINKKTKTIKFAMAAISASMLLLVSACSEPNMDNNSKSFNDNSKVSLHASWAENYDSLGAMSAGVDAVVIGEVTSQVKLSEKNGIPRTDTKVSVQSWLKGEPQPTSSSIEIRQTGGTLNGTDYEIHDDPLLASGTRAVFFLKLSPEGVYFIPGGPTGRLPIISNKVRLMEGSSLEINESLELNTITSKITETLK